MLLRALPLLFFFGSAMAAGTSWRERLAHAEELSGEGKNEEAVKAALGALADAEKDLGAESPETIHILARLSRVYEAAGDASQLPEMEKRLSAIKSKNFEVWLALGALWRYQEKFREAGDALKKALALKPDDLDAERELAMVDQDLGRDEEAVKLFEKLIKINPRNYFLYIKLARSDMRLGRSAEASEAFAQAKKINGRTAWTYIAEGYFHRDLGESAQAKEAFENAIAADTASPVGYHHLGAYLARQRQYPEAEKYFRQALEKLEANPNASTNDILHTISWLGSVILEQGRSAEAETVFRKCLEKAALSDHYVHCLLSLGDLYASQDKNAEAEDMFKRAAAACAEGPACTCRGRGLIGLGDFYLKQGRRREASAAADQAGNLCAGYHTSDLYFLMDLAGLYVSLDDVSKGEALYGRILALSRSMPLDGALPMAQGRLADLEMTQSRFHEAENLYREEIPIWENRRDGQQEADALDGLAAACEKEGKLQEAAQAREKANSLRARQ